MTNAPGRAAIAEKVKAIIAEMFDVPAESVTDETIVDDIPGWDSTTHVGLILEVEGQLEIEFDVERITAFQNVGELIDECTQEVGRA